MTRQQSPREMLIIILDDRELLPAVIKALYDAGVPGATVMDSIGGYRSNSWLEDIGLGGVARMFHVNELKQRTVIAVMEADIVDNAIAAAEKAVGGFGRPNSGILFTVPVSHTVGMFKRKRPETEETGLKVTPLDLTIRDMSVSKASDLMEGDEVIVRSNSSLAEVAQALLKRSSTHVAAVISREEHLIGLVTLRGLADRVFFGIMPELFLGESYDMGKAADFSAMANVRIASDFMIAPVAVNAKDLVSTAFRLMHEHDLSGLPVVDDEYRVVGFITLLELLELVLQEREIEQ